MIPLESYCFVNESTIRIEESTVLLNVINSTGEWVIATDTVNLFMIFVNDSINNCTSNTDHGTDLYHLDTKLYVIRMIVSPSGIIAGVANIVMHLMFKELRTVPGILIIFQCVPIVTILTISTLRSPFYYHHINTPAEVCAIIFSYLNVVCTNIYMITRATILAHFSYNMYRSYRLLEKNENERSLLYKYIIFIAVASAINSIIIITVDVTVDNSFEMEDGQCVYFFHASSIKDPHSSHNEPQATITVTQITYAMKASMVLRTSNSTDVCIHILDAFGLSFYKHWKQLRHNASLLLP